jgi:ABC-2 type transport system permease protein
MKMDLHSVFAIAKREYKAYFLSPIAYVYLVTFLVIVNWIFFRAFFLIGQADMRLFFGMMPWIFLFFVPAISMGKWAEERKLGTLEILFTMPIRDVDIIIAKFIAGLALIATALALTAPIAITVALVGDPDWGPIIGGYLGTLLLGGAYLSIGLMISAMTENQIIAFLLSVAASFVMLMLGTPLTVGGKSSFLSAIIQYAGLAVHFESIARGVVDSGDVIYYLSAIAFFLFVNLKVLETKARR